MLSKTGIPTIEDIMGVMPTIERLNRGPVAVIECYQNIPCNPCATACKRKAIKEFKDINDLPTINHEECNGCGLCISKCPGLAIMIIDCTYSSNEVLMKIPYEFIPLPKEGSIVWGLDRKGKKVCKVRVIKVQTSKVFDKTAIISIALEKKYLMQVRNIGLEDKDGR
jgi:Fe-S-cluster-containing hydrogenase component 2